MFRSKAQSAYRQDGSVNGGKRPKQRSSSPEAHRGEAVLTRRDASYSACVWVMGSLILPSRGRRDGSNEGGVAPPSSDGLGEQRGCCCVKHRCIRIAHRLHSSWPVTSFPVLSTDYSVVLLLISDYICTFDENCLVKRRCFLRTGVLRCQVAYLRSIWRPGSDEIPVVPPAGFPF
ncbi:conserved hypothetical protein [Coccidioides posadasii str. Silveira]|uniref:Uncharacterized protein n=1 Tax=Coccidioides posadasii (strain RMSCC 757 / Silveira) TaxID=443226 RepID=E9D4H6_COCPS|nr:conserved hypothetical protein [Coccidioides posadasii str. Silveira]